MWKSVRLNSTHYSIKKTPNKGELQQTAFNHSSDIDFKVFMNLYKECNGKAYYFLVIDATLASDNPSCFWKNLLATTKKLIMAIDDKITDEKMNYGINKEAAKISVLSSEKNDKNVYLTSEDR